MTVHELIEELQACDRPDAEVICLTSDIHNSPHSVWWKDVKGPDGEPGPVYIDSQAWMQKGAK